MEVVMSADPVRSAVRFPSGGVQCAAWHYRGDNGACVVMAPGFGVPKEPGTDRFALAFQAAGFSVLAFDYRGFGDSGGEAYVAGIGRQLEDFRSAVTFAQTLPGVDDGRVAAWGFSLSGGHFFRIATRDSGVKAAVAVSPNVDGPAASRNAARYTTLPALVRVTVRAVQDAVGGFVGAGPLLLPLTGPRGSTALLSTPDSQDGDRALDPDGLHAAWRRLVAARSALALSVYRPGRHAARVSCPLLVVVSDDDRTALSAPAVKAAGRVAHSEVIRLAGGHYASLLGGYEQAVAAQLEFLHRHLDTGTC
jgi:uncharacterized protein